MTERTKDRICFWTTKIAGFAIAVAGLHYDQHAATFFGAWCVGYSWVWE